jgi:hypothetical protein
MAISSESRSSTAETSCVYGTVRGIVEVAASA